MNVKFSYENNRGNSRDKWEMEITDIASNDNASTQLKMLLDGAATFIIDHIIGDKKAE